MLAVVCFRWNGNREYRPEYVNALARGYKRHLSMPHRFICVTDELEGFSDDVTVWPMPEAAETIGMLKSPEGPRYPSSYRRLWAFSDEARALGDTILMTDVDCVVTGTVDPLIEFMADSTFVGWRPPTTWGGVIRVAGGNWLLKAGAHTEVWERFTREGIAEARNAGQLGSDQAWISYCLAKGCTVWPRGAGIYEAQWMRANKFRVLPDSARIVHFNGERKPWHMLNISWIKEHWCGSSS